MKGVIANQTEATSFAVVGCKLSTLIGAGADAAYNSSDLLSLFSLSFISLFSPSLPQYSHQKVQKLQKASKASISSRLTDMMNLTG